MRTESPTALVMSVLGAALLWAGCGPGIEHNAVAEFPPVPEDRDVAFTEATPSCDHEKVGDLRVKASDWPAARSEVERTVREMGGEAVVGWNQRKVTVQEGGSRGSAVPGASTTRAQQATYYFGVVVRLQEECDVA